jgi:hypothetical protein
LLSSNVVCRFVDFNSCGTPVSFRAWARRPHPTRLAPRHGLASRHHGERGSRLFSRIANQLWEAGTGLLVHCVHATAWSGYLFTLSLACSYR